jgi:hypothetical protein
MTIAAQIVDAIEANGGTWKGTEDLCRAVCGARRMVLLKIRQLEQQRILIRKYPGLRGRGHKQVIRLQRKVEMRREP